MCARVYRAKCDIVPVCGGVGGAGVSACGGVYLSRKVRYLCCPRNWQRGQMFLPGLTAEGSYCSYSWVVRTIGFNRQVKQGLGSCCRNTRNRRVTFCLILGFNSLILQSHCPDILTSVCVCVCVWCVVCVVWYCVVCVCVVVCVVCVVCCVCGVLCVWCCVCGVLCVWCCVCGFVLCVVLYVVCVCVVLYVVCVCVCARARACMR